MHRSSDSRFAAGRWSRALLLVALATVLGFAGSLAPSPATAQSAAFCTADSQCPSGQLCCPIGGPSSLKRCTVPFNGQCPPVV